MSWHCRILWTFWQLPPYLILPVWRYRCLRLCQWTGTHRKVNDFVRSCVEDIRRHLKYLKLLSSWDPLLSPNFQWRQRNSRINWLPAKRFQHLRWKSQLRSPWVNSQIAHKVSSVRARILKMLMQPSPWFMRIYQIITTWPVQDRVRNYKAHRWS